MPTDNIEQTTEWNGALGRRWAQSQAQIDRIVVPFGDAPRCDAPVFPGATPRSAAENSARLGPASMLVREMGSEHLPAIVDGIEAALQALAAPDGQVSLNGSAWIVGASNPEARAAAAPP